MRNYNLVLALVVAAAVTGCAGSDSLKLSNGNTLVLPASGELRTWVGENVSDNDIPLVVEACEATKDKSTRVSELCQIAAARAAIIAL